MRGKLYQIADLRPQRRITPAHAGKTLPVDVDLYIVQDHPRACGENRMVLHIIARLQGSPPRMRGKRSTSVGHILADRITPAHAGKTTFQCAALTRFKDHPRACGENHDAEYIPQRFPGITPAHAGKTKATLNERFVNQDHPRACGENPLSPPPLLQRGGSPPRMRGKLLCTYYTPETNRITPAHAGKTFLPIVIFRSGWDHPRACGENLIYYLPLYHQKGSPPRMRACTRVSICYLIVGNLTCFKTTLFF